MADVISEGGNLAVNISQAFNETLNAISPQAAYWFGRMWSIIEIIGIAILLYILYSIIVAFMEWRKRKRIKRIEAKVDRIERKIDLLMKKENLTLKEEHEKGARKDKEKK